MHTCAQKMKMRHKKIQKTEARECSLSSSVVLCCCWLLSFLCNFFVCDEYYFHIYYNYLKNILSECTNDWTRFIHIFLLKTEYFATKLRFMTWHSLYATATPLNLLSFLLLALPHTHTHTHSTPCNTYIRIHFYVQFKVNAVFLFDFSLVLLRLLSIVCNMPLELCSVSISFRLFLFFYLLFLVSFLIFI